MPATPEPPYVHVMGRITDRRIAMIDRLRSDAVRRLALQPGERVIDAGCGNGACFPLLLRGVGPGGAVVAIEISPHMAERAARHVRENGWANVTLLVSPAETAPLEGQFDALLLFAAHEIFTSPPALDNLFAHLREGARVVAFGAKLAPPPLGWLFNPFFRLVSKKWLPHSPAIDPQPWRLLSQRLSRVQVEPRMGGVMYMVVGQK